MLRSNRTPSSAPRPAKQLHSGCAALFGLPFILGGLAVGWFLYFPLLHSWWSARHWEEVPCWIESSAIQSSISKKSTTFKTQATFRYVFDGRTYRSTAVSLGDGGTDNIGDFQQKAFAQIHAHEGQERPFRCYVNPAQPAEAVLFRDLRWGLLLLTSLFPTLFPLAGFAVTVLGGGAARRATHARKLQALHPAEPWRWNRAWTGELIQSTSPGLLMSLIAAAWLLLVQGPLAAAIIASGEIARTPTALLGLLPAGLSLIPLLLAWRQVQTRRTLGRPGLWLKQTPITPGRVMEAELRFDRALPPLSTVEVRALCERHITRRSGNSTSTTKEMIWENRETLSAAEARREASGVALPLRLAIPRGLPCPTVDDAALAAQDSEQHAWTLEVRSSQGGKPVTLPLPVFMKSGDAALAEAEAARAVNDDEAEEEQDLTPSTAQIQERLKQRGIHAEFDAAGIPTLIDCPPDRFRAFSVFLLLFGTVWSAVFFGLLISGAPFVFMVIWGITSPLIVFGGLWTLLHRRLVELSTDEMRILNTAGPFYSRRVSYERRHFVGFSYDSNMQSGNQFYYRVRAETIFGKKPTLIDGITESMTAQNLALKLEQWRKQSAVRIMTYANSDFGRKFGWFIEKNGRRVGQLDYVRWDESSQFWHDYRLTWDKPEEAVVGPDAWLAAGLVLRNRYYTSVTVDSFLTAPERDGIIPIRAALVREESVG